MEWIKCSDRLPDEYKDVISINNGVDTRFMSEIDIGYFDSDIDEWYSITHGRNFDMRHITHWMPLPSLPESS
ncbi:DUF551 domain-containing protein [Xenorhabdus entomophaga]|uniref:DUF551 domain-containing protein n=1 Tax=Xenorhabdus entomophaga TaxID=3136257 RepID=UPI0030F47EF9